MRYEKVFYTIGFSGMTYCIDVITADSSKLKNRALAYAFTSSPYIITAFAGPKASEDFYALYGWRWGFGVFSIVFPITAAPLYILFKLNLKKAKNRGVLAREPSGRTFLQSVWHYVIEFDGMLSSQLFLSALFGSFSRVQYGEKNVY
jgi:MFS family permease